ncbi:MAG TPA: serine/threonine-protein kinase [Burkholderiales bacterium]|nr:serine/threonine-protein kinase [Burkholderiales bacterium]
MKSGFWKTDWFLGLAVVIAFVCFNRVTDLVASLERKAYDLGVQASNRAPDPDIVVIAIDDTSIANIGRWPWQRDVLAKLTEQLAAAKPKVIGSTVLLSEPQLDRGYTYINKLMALVPPPADPATPENPILTVLKEAEQDLNTDRKLAEAYAKAGNVVIPMNFKLGAPLGKPDKPLPDYVSRNVVPGSFGSGAVARQAIGVEAPIEPLGKAAFAIGHLTNPLDVDGTVRTEALALQYYDQLFPSLSLMIAAKSRNLGPADMKLQPGEGISLGKSNIRAESLLEMQTYFYKDRDGRPAFPVDSFFDVYSGKIPAGKYAGKIVLIGATASGVAGTFVTPVSGATAPVLSLAHSVSSILQEHFFVVPPWAAGVEVGVFFLVVLYLIVLLPRLNASLAASITSFGLAALIVAHVALMSVQGMWLQLMGACTLLLAGHLALVTKRFIGTERAKVKSDQSSAESNRMLGLAYQGQGQLDLAWDKFRQVPMSEALSDNLYNLGLDFERKRQFNKAEAVFRHIHAFDAKFRDVGEKITRTKQLSETVILGGGSHPGGTLQLNAGEKPKFGRFQVEKELGKGAMGVVYLGKDPKIGREVAIKTLALTQEFEADEIAGVKERFFREAETAGKLTHPSIVTIYDAGEEHDYCFIAMELLKGGDLVPFTKKGHLLQPEKVVSIVARAADALGYAHREGVVHRDVKPANMMYNPETDTLKLTDFGIARLTASSKTKTGMVLGTPSYMSPEQLAGSRVDGRSDLFSLGVTLYQLLCGQLPFDGDSMAQLMFRIANEAPVDIRTVNAGVSPRLVAFLGQALSKKTEERFQTGEEFGGALRAALAAGAPQAAAAAGGVDIEL